MTFPTGDLLRDRGACSAGTTAWARVARERGSMAVEVVVFIPILMALMLVVIAWGRVIDTQGNLEAISRDAVRAASLERSFGAGAAAMNHIVDASLPDRVTCDEPILGGTYESGEIITVTMNCVISYDGLGLIGLDGGKSITVQSSAPIDEFRRTE